MRASSGLRSCTWERFARRADGKSDGFDLVTVILADVSAYSVSEWQSRQRRGESSIPHLSI